jgi:hypothetical protein
MLHAKRPGYAGDLHVRSLEIPDLNGLPFIGKPFAVPQLIDTGEKLLRGCRRGNVPVSAI